MTIFARTSAVFCLAAVSIAVSANAEDWYQWRGPDRNGISKETGWLTNWPEGGPKQLWKASVGWGFSDVTISKGRVYTQGNSGNKNADGPNDTDTIFCFDEKTGEVVWKHSYPCLLDPNFYPGGTSATPTVDGDQVYTVSKKGDLFCFDAAKGTVIWNKSIIKDYGIDPPTWGFASSPFIYGDLLVVNAGKAGTAFNKKTGALVWSSDKTPSGYANLVPFKVGSDDCVAILASKTLEVVKVADGKSVWSYPWKTDNDINAGDPIISEGKMFFGSGYNHGCTVIDISKDQPTQVWENKNLCNKFNIPILYKGYVYCGEEKARGQFKCLDWNTGEVKWSDRSMGQGGITMADGKIIGLSEKGELMVANATPDGFQPFARAQIITGGTCWTPPVLSNGHVYCRSGKGDLVCVDLSGK